jgi:hypothetical protein
MPATNADPAKRARAQEIVDFLNSLVEIDREAIHTIMASHMPCNDAMADHPTVQVRAYKLDEDAADHGCTVEPLGILNGFVGVDDESRGFIEMMLDDATGKLVGFRVAPLKFENEKQGTPTEC